VVNQGDGSGLYRMEINIKITFIKYSDRANPIVTIPKVKKFKFSRNKYGRELLIDCRKFSETQKFVLTDEPFTTSYYEMYFITEGKAEFLLDAEEFSVEKSTVIFLHPQRISQWKKTLEEVDGYFLIFENEFIENYFQDILFIHRFHFFHNTTTPSFIKLKQNQFEKIVQILKEIRYEIKMLNSDSHHLLRSLFYYLLITLNRIYSEAYTIKSHLFQNNRALRFKKLIEANYKTLKTVEKYSRIIGTSRQHLNNTVKAVLGKSASQMIKDRILIEAKRQLLFSDKTFAEIAFELNFSEPSNFHRFFKKQTGISARKFKEEFSK
jgi:AraC-like DNA-binding protein